VCNRLTKKRLRGFVIAYTQMCEILAEGNSDPLAYEAIREELHGILVDVCTSVLGAEHACEALRKRAQRRRIEYTNFSVVLRDLTNLKPPGRKVFTGSGGEAAFIGECANKDTMAAIDTSPPVIQTVISLGCCDRE
jgi:hypothetical protein